jgi:hypothetical protein
MKHRADRSSVVLPAVVRLALASARRFPQQARRVIRGSRSSGRRENPGHGSGRESRTRGSRRGQAVRKKQAGREALSTYVRGRAASAVIRRFLTLPSA